MAKCHPGDLAVIVSAKHPINIGAIVRVVRLHDGKWELRFPHWPEPVWWITSAFPLKWTAKGGVAYWRSAGPCPDFKLQPIRGKGDAGKDVSTVKRDEKVTA